MNSPLVTFIIPVYNGERTLAPAIESVLAQDYQPFELIVVDDGSTDCSVDVARSYDLRCISQPNQGVAAAQNTGLAAARGQLVSFLGADDRVPSNKLSLQVGFLLSHPEVACVLGRQEISFDGVEQPAWMRRDPVFGDLDGVNLSSGVIRRSALEHVGGFDASFGRSEDRDLLVRLRAAGFGIAVLPEVVLYRTFHGSNLTLDLPQRHPLLRSLKGKLDRERAAGSTADPHP
jgi:glycosyltransferase involved in cell wall biosynthesis